MHFPYFCFCITGSSRKSQKKRHFNCYIYLHVRWFDCLISKLSNGLTINWIVLFLRQVAVSTSGRGGLWSFTTSNLVTSRCRLSAYGSRAPFSVAGPICWNAPPDLHGWQPHRSALSLPTLSVPQVQLTTVANQIYPVVGSPSWNDHARLCDIGQLVIQRPSL